MVALAASRNTRKRNVPTRRTLPMAASAKGYAGGMACRDASGNLVAGAVSTTLKCLGIFIGDVDNTGGAAGAVSGTVERGTFQFANSASGDLIAKADIGNDCYIVDDQTVAKTNGTSTRSIAGKVYDVDAEGVWVEFI